MAIVVHGLRVSVQWGKAATKLQRTHSGYTLARRSNLWLPLPPPAQFSSEPHGPCQAAPSALHSLAASTTSPLLIARRRSRLVVATCRRHADFDPTGLTAEVIDIVLDVLVDLPASLDE